MNTVDYFFADVHKHIPHFKLGSCLEFSDIKITKVEGLGLVLICTFNHASLIRVVVEFSNVWNIEFYSSGGSMGLVEPFIEPATTSGLGKEYFQFFDEGTKSRWHFETIRLVEVVAGVTGGMAKVPETIGTVAEVK